MRAPLPPLARFCAAEESASARRVAADCCHWPLIDFDADISTDDASRHY